MSDGGKIEKNFKNTRDKPTYAIDDDDYARVQQNSYARARYDTDQHVSCNKRVPRIRSRAVPAAAASSSDRDAVAGVHAARVALGVHPSRLAATTIRGRGRAYFPSFFIFLPPTSINIFFRFFFVVFRFCPVLTYLYVAHAATCVLSVLSGLPCR